MVIAGGDNCYDYTGTGRSVWSVRSVSCVWLNQTNQIDQMNQTDQRDQTDQTLERYTQARHDDSTTP
jgi:hypothetical protein